MQPTAQLQQSATNAQSSNASLQPQASPTQNQSTQKQPQQDVLGAEVYRSYDKLTVAESGTSSAVTPVSTQAATVWWFLLFALLVLAAVILWRFLRNRRTYVGSTPEATSQLQEAQNTSNDALVSSTLPVPKKSSAKKPKRPVKKKQKAAAKKKR